MGRETLVPHVGHVDVDTFMLELECLDTELITLGVAAAEILWL